MTEEEVRRYQENKRKQHPDVAPFLWLFLKLKSEMHSDDAFKGLSEDDLETKAAEIAGRLINSYRESMPSGIIPIDGDNSIFLYKELIFKLMEKIHKNATFKELNKNDVMIKSVDVVVRLIKIYKESTLNNPLASDGIFSYIELVFVAMDKLQVAGKLKGLNYDDTLTESIKTAHQWLKYYNKEEDEVRYMNPVDRRAAIKKYADEQAIKNKPNE